MSEAPNSPELNTPFEKISYGDGVVYISTISPESFVASVPKEQEIQTSLNTMVASMTKNKEAVLGTALLSTATSEDWPANKFQYSLVVVGASAKTHSREVLPKDFKKMYEEIQSSDVMTARALMGPDWKHLFKGSLQKEAVFPLAYFTDKAIQTYGKNINVSVDMPNSVSFFAHMMATKRTDASPLIQSIWMKPQKTTF